MNRQRRQQILSTFAGSILLMVILLNGCGIVESEQPERGALQVSVWDTTTGEALTGADIIIDDIPRQERTPATLLGLSSGLHQLNVRPPELDYPAIDTAVTITPPETQILTLLTGPSSAPGFLRVITTPASAIIHVDFRHGSHTSGTVLPILPGNHLLSAWAAEHTMADPGYVTVSIRAEDTTNVKLMLSAEKTGIGIGELAPNLTLSGDLGGDYSLAQFRGAVLLLNFAGFDCDPCRRELPGIQRVFEQYVVDGCHVLVINVGWYNDGPNDFASIREDLNLTMPLLYAETPDGNATTIYNIAAAPTNILIDRRGIIRHRFGETTETQLEELVLLLL